MNRLKRFDAVHFRHVKVEENGRRSMALNPTEGFESTMSNRDLTSFSSQPVRESHRHIDIIVHQQDRGNLR